ncbi:hypothetical protein ACHAXT_008947 [Thalassiosira profunda]
MPPRIPAHERRRRKSRRRTPITCSLSRQLALLAACLLFHPTIQSNDLAMTFGAVSAEPRSSIPRSNNRYTHYGSDASSSSGVDTLSSPLNKNSYHPPWNPSPKIDPRGFLSECYGRCPGEWESLANIRGKHGPRNRSRHERLLSVPCQIRQVPGDGNCLFHSVAACLHRVERGEHLPLDSFEEVAALRERSRSLRNAAVDALQNVQNKGRRRLFLQGEECLEARELLAAAAAQFELDGEGYCDLMRKEGYWGGGPEIVALCNHLQRPIHIYELIPADEAPAQEEGNKNSDRYGNLKRSSQFSLRRMACFGSPKFDRREPLHVLSADSRFPDIEPRRIRRVAGEEKEGVRFRRHALIRGGSRVDGGDGPGRTTRGKPNGDKWGEGGSWARDALGWFAGGGEEDLDRQFAYLEGMTCAF